MSIKKVVIIGDTRYFHIGSRTNCFYLCRVIESDYDLLGLFGGKSFYFKNYSDFSKRIKGFRQLYTSLEKSDAIICHGEGMIEPNSIYSSTLFYLVTYVREKWPDKRILLINFSCYDQRHWDWSIFDALIPRDRETYNLLSPVHPRVSLGFDCSILQASNIDHDEVNKKNLVLVFRGRKSISKKEIQQLKKFFGPSKKVVMVSAFWQFDKNDSAQIKSLQQLQSLFQRAHLVVSSSFHGIVFSARFGVPFIPIKTIGTKKNESIAVDILGSYYKTRDLSRWLEFYSDEKKYKEVREYLKRVLPRLQKRALVYPGVLRKELRRRAK